jgi:hypothetical protein
MRVLSFIAYLQTDAQAAQVVAAGDTLAIS